ncbi:hypothetical protein MTR_0848s0010, partial [Medicago truncatula]
SEKPQSEETKVESEKPNVPPPYKPKIPFEQRFTKSKLDEKFRKFVEMLNKLYINVPYNKRKIEKDETVNLTEERSAIIQNKFPPKLKDPGSFSIPCVIGSDTIEKSMCDLGESVNLMPLSLCENLGGLSKNEKEKKFFEAL